MNTTISKSNVKSKGVVVFAFNTSVDYVAIADQTSQLIAHNLQLPITLITDHNAEPQFTYDQVIRVDQQGATYRTEDANIQWRNFGRYLAYELSPYDETILLDTDYLVLDGSLLNLFETDFDYKLMHHNCDEQGASYEQMGNTSLPFIWATVILFRKTERARMLFDLVGKIQRNYNYYRLLYNIREGNYRNDYAFAIANIILNGYSINEEQGIPWRMFTLTSKIDRLVVDSANVRAYFKDRKPLFLPNQNIHVMDKAYLQTDQFKNFVRIRCESI
jgi:hypothetical protein